MSTSALFVFRSENHHGKEVVAIHRHGDGYPFDSILAIRAAVDLSWPAKARTRTRVAGRYEASEFAASFIAANKTGPGGFYIVDADADSFQNYVYLVTHSDGELQVRVTKNGEDMFDGSLTDAAIDFCEGN